MVWHLLLPFLAGCILLKLQAAAAIPGAATLASPGSPEPAEGTVQLTAVTLTLLEGNVCLLLCDCVGPFKIPMLNLIS